MAIHIHQSHIVIVLVLIPFISFSSSSSKRSYNTLTQGSSLSPGDFLFSSPTGTFTAGFHPVGENAYCFAIWFTTVSANKKVTVVWMANRNEPVNGRKTKLSLLDSGNLVLTDAGQLVVWTSGTKSLSSPQLQLHDNGTLVLYTMKNGTNVIAWQSFDSPTNTLLPRQPFTGSMTLISSRSPTNHSSGFYKLYFDNDNVIRLLYEGNEVKDVFWPPAWLKSWGAAGRSTDNSSEIAKLDTLGKFDSSDDFKFKTSDLGRGPRRRMVLDPDGIIRVYSLHKRNGIWAVTWQSSLQPCKTHGICGANSICTYNPESGPRCSCLPGYKMKNLRDWSEGCSPDFELPCHHNDSSRTQFLNLSHTEFDGYNIGYYKNYTLGKCKRLCLRYCSCKGFLYKFERDAGVYSCLPKKMMFNGYQCTGSESWTYIRLPKNGSKASDTTSMMHKSDHLQCRPNHVVEIERAYKVKREYRLLVKSLAWGAGVVGAIEVTCLLIFFFKTCQSPSTGSFYFKRFTYDELKKASCNFREEIGRGGSGVVYKGILSDNRIAAIKCLNEADKQGEAEFFAEVGTIGGRLNHANLIERWGYCAEGKHRILVYEYLENGSLAENLYSINNINILDWRKRFEIALGTAKGLCYLHEECLEWILHCDVKPQNILLDANYQAKVADFGLSKQAKRSAMERLNVSMIRGTRGYMAPEWVLNLPITSKVDVYSYGIVVLEIVTGKSPQEFNSLDGINNGGMQQRTLENWVREMMHEDQGLSSSWTQIADPRMGGEYDADRLEKLVKVALLCAQVNKDARPTMRHVIDMLLD